MRCEAVTGSVGPLLLPRVVGATLLAFVLLCVAGCMPPGRSRYSSVPGGRVATPGIVITAEDGAFVLRSGERFERPFESWTPIDLAELDTSDYPAALRGGARRVRVDVAGRQPLFGVLALDPAPTCASGPGTRSYEIQVPEQYVEDATGGRVSVVYETVTCSCCPDGRQYTWALWLSDQPLR